MDCTRYRELVSADAVPAAALDHARSCAGCGAWTDALDAIRHAAPAAIAAAPADLADRLVSATLGVDAVGTVDTGPPVSASAAARADTATRPTAVPGPAPAPGATPAAVVTGSRIGTGAVATLAAAAVTIGAVALVTLSGGGDPGRGDPVRVLGAAVDAVSAAGTGFAFTIDGSLETEVDLPELPDVGATIPPLPELPELPSAPVLPGLPTFDAEAMCGAMPAPARAACLGSLGDVEIPDVQAEVDATMEEARQAMERAMALSRARLESARASLTEARLEFERVTGQAIESVERAAHLDVSFDGRGTGDGRGAVDATIDYRFVSPLPDTGSLDVRTVDGTSYIRSDLTGGWVSMPGSYDGFVIGELSAPRDVHSLLADLRTPGADVEELGDARRDGVTARGLRFRSRSGAQVTAWIGATDGLLREVTWLQAVGGAGEPVQLDAHTTIRFTDFGRDVRIEAPVDATPIAELPPHLHPPFSVTLGIELRLDATARTGAPGG